MRVARRKLPFLCRAAVATAAALGSLAAASIPAASATLAAAPPARHAAPQPAAPVSAVSLDTLTRDGGSASPASRGAADSASGAQTMNVGGAALRAVLSLGAVLALVVGAINYLKRKGYGANAPAPVSAPGMPRPQFGISPVAQLLIAARQSGGVSPTASSPSRREAAGGIAEFELLGTQKLPGSGHTLYKVRVGERELLLGGAPSGTLSVLTEWDIEPRADADSAQMHAPELERRFDGLLDRLDQDGRVGIARQRPVDGSGDTLQSAAERLTAAIRRASASSSPSFDQNALNARRELF